MSSMLFEVYRCVQLNRWSVVCGCVLHRGQRGEVRCVFSTLCRYSVYVGGVVDVVQCGLFFSQCVCGWIVSLCSGCCVFCLICDA